MQKSPRLSPTGRQKTGTKANSLPSKLNMSREVVQSLVVFEVCVGEVRIHANRVDIRPGEQGVAWAIVGVPWHIQPIKAVARLCKQRLSEAGIKPGGEV